MNYFIPLLLYSNKEYKTNIKKTIEERNYLRTKRNEENEDKTTTREAILNNENFNIENLLNKSISIEEFKNKNRELAYLTVALEGGYN